MYSRISSTKLGSRVTVSGTSNSFKGKTFYGGFLEYGWKSGRRVRNAELGAARGAKRTASQRSEAERRNSSRRQVAGTGWMKKAAQAKRQMALGIYRAETIRWVRELAKVK